MAERTERHSGRPAPHANAALACASREKQNGGTQKQPSGQWAPLGSNQRPGLATFVGVPGLTASSAMIPLMEQRHVKLSGDIEGSFVIEEALADGRFVVAPEWPSRETSADAILERAGAKRMSPKEFDKHFGDLPTDGEG
jgi:hypothetical protein